MTRSTKRMAAALVALLLVLTSLESALGAHHCPHHDGTATTAAPSTTQSGHGHEHDASPEPGSHGPCTCVGECQAGAAPSLPIPAIAVELPAPPTFSQAPRSPRPALRPAIVPYALPWGNAPPSL